MPAGRRRGRDFGDGAVKLVKISAPGLEAEVTCAAFSSIANAAAGTHIISFTGTTKATVWDSAGPEDERTSLTMIEVASLASLIAYNVD